MSPTLRWRWLGRLSWEEALTRQLEVRDVVEAGGAMVVLGCEHPPTFTLGRRAAAGEVFGAGDIPVHVTDRGGRATYHGPGQAVVYPVVRLGDLGLGVRRYVRCLEGAMIRWLAERGVRADRDAENPGVWIGDAKIAAIGVHVRRGVTTHGLALNVSTDLEPFGRFVPCGLPFHGVARLADLVEGRPPTVEEAARGIAETLADEVGATLESDANE